MDYSRFEHGLCEKLVQAGWIVSWSSDRNDTYITWSDLGAAHKATFIEDVTKIIPCDTDELKALLWEFARYHGRIELSELEKVKSQASWMIGEGPYILVTCDSLGNAEYALFHSRDDEAAYPLMLEATKAEREVIILECHRLREGNLPRLTPFGARGYWIQE